jgi:hypothetical protein
MHIPDKSLTDPEQWLKFQHKKCCWRFTKLLTVLRIQIHFVRIRIRIKHLWRFQIRNQVGRLKIPPPPPKKKVTIKRKWHLTLLYRYRTNLIALESFYVYLSFLITLVFLSFLIFLLRIQNTTVERGKSEHINMFEPK